MPCTRERRVEAESQSTVRLASEPVYTTIFGMFQCKVFKVFKVYKAFQSIHNHWSQKCLSVVTTSCDSFFSRWHEHDMTLNTQAIPASANQAQGFDKLLPTNTQASPIFQLNSSVQRSKYSIIFAQLVKAKSRQCKWIPWTRNSRRFYDPSIAALTDSILRS